MISRKVKLLIDVFVLMVILLACENGTEILNRGVEHVRRDYVEGVGSIQIESEKLESLWGSSSSDVWVCGVTETMSGSVWHFNGNEWKSDSIVSKIIKPRCVYGFSQNNVWMAGENGKILHFDGTEWRIDYVHNISGVSDIRFYDMYGNSSNDLYVTGAVWYSEKKSKGIILHYDGSKWEQKYLADFNSCFYNIKSNSSNSCFIKAIKHDFVNFADDTTVFYEYKENNLKELYSDENMYIKKGFVNVIDRKIYFSLRDAIYEYKENRMVKLFNCVYDYTASSIYGRNEKDIFICANTFGIEHYNGIDIIPLFHSEPIVYSMMIFEKDIIYLCSSYENTKTYIYHFRLK